MLINNIEKKYQLINLYFCNTYTKNIQNTLKRTCFQVPILTIYLENYIYTAR